MVEGLDKVVGKIRAVGFDGALIFTELLELKKAVETEAAELDDLVGGTIFVELDEAIGKEDFVKFNKIDDDGLELLGFDEVLDNDDLSIADVKKVEDEDNSSVVVDFEEVIDEDIGLVLAGVEKVEGEGVI